MARMVFPLASTHMSYGLYAISDVFGNISKWLLCYALMRLCHFLLFQSCLMMIRLCPMLFGPFCEYFLWALYHVL